MSDGVSKSAHVFQVFVQLLAMAALWGILGTMLQMKNQGITVHYQSTGGSLGDLFGVGGDSPSSPQPDTGIGSGWGNTGGGGDSSGGSPHHWWDGWFNKDSVPPNGQNGAAAPDAAAQGAQH